MDKQSALSMLELYHYSKFPTSPDHARKLYRDAGLEIPDHLKEVELSDEEKKFRHEMVMKLFAGLSGGVDDGDRS